jgi:hypothetical protein
LEVFPVVQAGYARFVLLARRLMAAHMHSGRIRLFDRHIIGLFRAGLSAVEARRFRLVSLVLSLLSYQDTYHRDSLQQ